MYMYRYVLGASILSLCVRLDFETIPTVRHFFLSFILLNLVLLITPSKHMSSPPVFMSSPHVFMSSPPVL